MKTIDSKAPILVTGGSGFIASHIVRMLLERGHTVHATVRNKSKTERYAHLTEAAEKSPGTLKIFQADLLDEGAFAEAMTGCALVMHTASPFVIQGIKDVQKELIQPALQGTRNVLQTANATPTVQRIVLTSSVVSIYGDGIETQNVKDGTFTEAEWNTTSTEKHQPYSYSKVIAEREAWKIAEAQDRWDLVVINPAFVLGPPMGNSRSASLATMNQMIDGTMKMGFPDLYFGLVDVREVAQAHIEAGFRPEAKGRHILAHTKGVGLGEIAAIGRKKYGNKYPIPKKPLPKFLLFLAGPFQGFSWKYLRSNLGFRPKFDNQKSKRALGITYRPVEETVLAHFDSMVD